MIFKFISIVGDNSLRCTYGQSTLTLSQIGVAGDGDTGIIYEPMPEAENSEKSTLSKEDSDLIRLCMSLTTLELTGCGVAERQSREKMRSAMLHSLMKSREDLFVNLGR